MPAHKKPSSSHDRDRYEDRIKKELFRKMLYYTGIVTNFSVPATFILSRVYDSLFMFYCFLACLPMYFWTYILYHWTFKSKRMSYQDSAFGWIIVMLSTVVILTFIAGGYSGAVISAYVTLGIVGAIFLTKRNAMTADMERKTLRSGCLIMVFPF